jgi:hypothetical protein
MRQFRIDRRSFLAHAVARYVLPLHLAWRAALGASPSLKELYDAHRYFDLCQAVRIQGAPAFYRGAVACAFGDEKSAERLLSRVIRDSPRSWEANEARGLLVFMYMRQGRNHEALRTADEALGVDPTLDPQNFRSMIAAYCRFPDLSVEHRAYSRVQGKIEGDNLFVPVLVNGKAARWMLDTGANFSIVAESEARALGLSMIDGRLQGKDDNGGQVAMAVAMAETLQIGNIRLRNVGMATVPDSGPPMNSLPTGKRGIIGLPVLLQLGSIRWRSDGSVELDAPSKRQGEPNLCIDGFSPLTPIGVGGRALDFLLDTGNGAGTQLWPKFAEDFPELVREKGRTGAKKVTQIGGAAERDIIMLPELHLRLGGFDALLKPAHIFGKPVGNDFYYGLAGMDLMLQAREVIIDFPAMRVELKD